MVWSAPVAPAAPAAPSAPLAAPHPSMLPAPVVTHVANLTGPVDQPPPPPPAPVGMCLLFIVFVSVATLHVLTRRRLSVMCVSIVYVVRLGLLALFEYHVEPRTWSAASAGIITSSHLHFSHRHFGTPPCTQRQFLPWRPFSRLLQRHPLHPRHSP